MGNVTTLQQEHKTRSMPWMSSTPATDRGTHGARKSKPKTLSEKVNKDAAFRLPFVRRREPIPEGFGIEGPPPGVDWWYAPASDYYHQNEEIGRVFCQEAFRAWRQSPKRIEQVLRFTLADMVNQGRESGIEAGFLSELLHAALSHVAAQEVREVAQP
jgi:hypothetical protein